MYRGLLGIAGILLFTISGAALAGGNGPAIIPEQLQKLSIDYLIAERLQIDWNHASPGDVGRYMGFLAAANEVAVTIAEKNGRMHPGENDYKAALAALGIWPPNKPALVQKYWPRVFPAFHNQNIRVALRTAVGSVAIDLSTQLEKPDWSDASVNEIFPQNLANYFKYVLDFRIVGK